MNQRIPQKLLLLYVIAVVLSQSPAYSLDKVIGEKRFEKLSLINPSETLENAKVKLYIDGDIIIIHSDGVTTAKSERLSEKILKDLNFYSDERIEYAKLQGMEEKARAVAIAQKDEQVSRRFERLEGLSDQIKTQLEEGKVKFDSGSDIDRYLYNEFRKSSEKDLFKSWIEKRFGKPDYSGKNEWKMLVNYSPIQYSKIEYDHWVYFNILKNRDTDKYTEDVSFSFRSDDIFYNYTGPDWVLNSDTYQSLKGSVEIMHESMIKNY